MASSSNSTRTIRDLAKWGRFEDLQRQASSDAEVDLALIFERAATDFRTVPRRPGHLRILKWCIDQGLDVDARVGAYHQPIVCLAAAAGNREIIEYIRSLKRLSDPFHWASLGEVELLRRYGVDNRLAALRDVNGFNLLFYCAASGLGRRDDSMKQRLEDVCEFLLEQDVDPLHEVFFGLPIFPAFLCAASGGNAQILQLLLKAKRLSTDKIQQSLEHCLEPHQRSGEPFYDVAEGLIEQGVDLNEWRASQGRTLLHGAAHRGSVQAVRWLLEKGADQNCKDSNGRTPLHVCAQRNTTTAVVDLLLARGCSWDATDSSGKRALDYARENHRSLVVKRLETAGRC
jgi:ankyrin repeat protein